MTPSTGFDSQAFRDRHVLVVGGTSGIGAAIANAFIAHGASARVTGATPEEVAAAASEVPQATSRSVLDVRDDGAVKACIAAQPRIDVLVNCAGIIRRNQELDPNVFADVIDINLNGSLRTCSAARAALAATQGCIVNIASMLSFFGSGFTPGYSASKGGVAQLTKSLAIAFAPDRVRVNALAPGYIATRFTQALQDDPARNSTIIGRTPMGRWGTPQDVAQCALFLASPAAGFVTGVVLPVDGGYLVQ